MIDDSWDMKPIVGAKLLRMKVRDNEFIAEFDNGRTLTMLLSIKVQETAIVPEAQLICGYHNHGKD
jgi:hypothetical protein